MPPEPGRPMPRDDKKMVTGEDDEKGSKAQEEIIKKANDKSKDMDLNDDKEGELEGDEALNAVSDKKYSERIQQAIEDIRANGAEYLSKDGLEKYSPKFLTILELLAKLDLTKLSSSQASSHWISILIFGFLAKLDLTSLSLSLTRFRCISILISLLLDILKFSNWDNLALTSLFFKISDFISLHKEKLWNNFIKTYISLSLDIKIIFYTVLVILKGSGK